MKFLSSILIAASLLTQGAQSAVLVPAVNPANHPQATLSSLEPQGKNVTINGVLTYVTLPKGRFDEKTAVVLLTGRYSVSMRTMTVGSDLIFFSLVCRCIWTSFT